MTTRSSRRRAGRQRSRVSSLARRSTAPTRAILARSSSFVHPPHRVLRTRVLEVGGTAAHLHTSLRGLTKERGGQVLCRGGQTVELSNDHKPFNDVEKARIEKAGGFVEDKRVNGSDSSPILLALPRAARSHLSAAHVRRHPAVQREVSKYAMCRRTLAVARAMGDFSFKTSPELSAEQQQVTCDPEIRKFTIEDKDEFIILACDGIWDVVSSERAVDMVREMLKTNMPLKDILSEIFDACLSLRQTRAWAATT